MGADLTAQIELLLVDRQGKMTQISPNHPLKTGDRIHLRLTTNTDAQYHLYTLDKSGKNHKSLLVKGQSKKATTILLPSPQQGFLQLDANPGLEWLKLELKAKTKHKTARLKKYPYGKIEQVMLRNIELRAPMGQNVEYDPLKQVIYLSAKKSAKKSAENLNQLSLKLGLDHTVTKSAALKR